MFLLCLKFNLKDSYSNPAFFEFFHNAAEVEFWMPSVHLSVTFWRVRGQSTLNTPTVSQNEVEQGRNSKYVKR